MRCTAFIPVICVSQKTAASQIHVDTTKKSSRTDFLPKSVGMYNIPFSHGPINQGQTQVNTFTCANVSESNPGYTQVDNLSSTLVTSRV